MRKTDWLKPENLEAIKTFELCNDCDTVLYCSDADGNKLELRLNDVEVENLLIQCLDHTFGEKVMRRIKGIIDLEY